MTNTCVIGESDPFISQLLTRFAKESGMAVVTAQVGQDVLKLTRHVKPNFIIIDNELPGKMRGWEVVRSLKADRETGCIPVIICSWQQEAEVRMQLNDITSYLQKPDLHYDDFVGALITVGVTTDDSFSS